MVGKKGKVGEVFVSNRIISGDQWGCSLSKGIVFGRGVFDGLDQRVNASCRETLYHMGSSVIFRGWI